MKNMKLYKVSNPYASHGFLLVKSETIDDALYYANQYLNVEYGKAIERGIITKKIPYSVVELKEVSGVYADFMNAGVHE